MKYKKRARPTIVDYGGKNFQPCWTCSKACGGCSWSRDGTPIDGWKAKPTYISANVGYEQSYKVSYCPQYENDERNYIRKCY